MHGAVTLRTGGACCQHRLQQQKSHLDSRQRHFWLNQISTAKWPLIRCKILHLTRSGAAGYTGGGDGDLTLKCRFWIFVWSWDPRAVGFVPSQLPHFCKSLPRRVPHFFVFKFEIAPFFLLRQHVGTLPAKLANTVMPQRTVEPEMDEPQQSPR